MRWAYPDENEGTFLPRASPPQFCSTQTAFEDSTLETESITCLGDRQTFAFPLGNAGTHKSVAITVAHGSDDLALFYRNGGWVQLSSNKLDASSTDNNNQACIYLTLDADAEQNYWSYIELTGASSNSTIVVDFDTQGCRPIQ